MAKTQRPAEPLRVTRPPDELGERLVARGLVPNLFLLDNNGTLSPPWGVTLPGFWNEPSRLFQFPIEVSPVDDKGQRRIGLIHPLLVDHPFVQQVAGMGIEIDPNGAPNDAGYSHRQLGLWWHAVDLMTAGKWRQLLETRRFTTDAHITHAVGHALRYDRCLAVPTARAILRTIGVKEPADRGAILRASFRPSPCAEPKKRTRWPINHPGLMTAEDQTWNIIFGLEAGWFAHFNGHIEWTDEGRERFAAGNTSSFVEAKTGQGAFAF